MADDINPILNELITALTRQTSSLATAESCTGGWVAKCCTDRPGSSVWFAGGIVAYRNAVKTRLLGVSPALLDREGAVSGPVAEAMASGARDSLQATFGLGVTGVAGPDGGSDSKPVGTVWIAWAGPEKVESRPFRFAGDRNDVRWATVLEALVGLHRHANALSQV